MNIKKLRYECRGWKWHAVRIGGFGRIVYIGERGEPDAGDYEQVEVYAVASLCGPSDDDFTSKWMVRSGPDGSTLVEGYASWWLRTQASKNEACGAMDST